MTDTPHDRSRRARARRNWPVVKTRLTDERQTVLAPTVALGMMWQLAVDAWASAGRTLPEYSRAQMPVVCYREHDAKKGTP